MRGFQMRMSALFDFEFLKFLLYQHGQVKRRLIFRNFVWTCFMDGPNLEKLYVFTVLCNYILLFKGLNIQIEE